MIPEVAKAGKSQAAAMSDRGRGGGRLRAEARRSPVQHHQQHGSLAADARWAQAEAPRAAISRLESSLNQTF